MVLGTAHLSNAAEDWDPKVLDLLLDRLASFKPDVIAIEDQPGPTASKLWSYRSIYPEAAATFAGRALLMATVAGLSLDMDMPQAEAELRRHIGKVGDNPTAAARRRSAALLEDLGGERGEGVLLAARLAVRLGLERLFQIDSQEEDVLTPEESDVFAQKIFPLVGERYNADPAAKERGKIEDMTTPDAALAAYRKLNDDRIERRLSEIEWLGAIKERTEGDVGRKRVAAWESRNLRMAANIREARARAPGGRVLVIVGATHKIWLEAYLGMMSDIKVVSTDTILR